MSEINELLDQLKRLREKRDGYELQVEDVQEEIDSLEEELHEFYMEGILPFG